MVKKGAFLKLGMIFGTFSLCYFSFLAVEVIAQDIFPAKEITLICGSEVGGGMDIYARGMTIALSRAFKKLYPEAKGGEVKVKNMPGAGHAKAYTYVFKEAKPDGYTIGDFVKGELYKFIYGSEKFPFDVREFIWLFSGDKSERILIANKKRFNIWEDFLAMSKKEPITFVTGSIGGTAHIETIFFKELTGIPGKIGVAGGTAQAVATLIRGEGDVFLATYDGVKALVDSKEVNVLISTTKERILPQVPTIIEKGFPNIMKYAGGLGNILVGPPKLDPQAKLKIVAALKEMVKDPEYLEFCSKMGMKSIPAYDEEIRNEIMEYCEILREWTPTFRKHGF